MSGLRDKIKSYDALYLLIIALLLWLFIYAQTLYSMVEIWWRSDTFAHGFLIFPISLYLIYQKRKLFNSTQKQHSFFFLFLLALCTFTWVIANAVDVIVIQQLMVISMLPLIVGSLYGFKLLNQYLFPFCYLLFAVPIGEFLVPKLQQITAVITVFCLELSQIPVFNEGMFISVPSGDFEVAIACSGIRYLIASMALGTLYAYLMYSSFLKRGLFILASLVVPIFANGIRAYGIILIAHLSDMKYATGVDHLIYGWLFFGIVIFVLFYIGSFWEDIDSVDKINKNTTDILLTSAASPDGIQKAFLVGITAILLTGPVYSLWMHEEQQLNVNSTLSAPYSSNDWLRLETVDKQWTPIFINADEEVRVDYIRTSTSEAKGAKIYLYKNEYLFEQQGKELINSLNVFYDIKRWVVIDSGKHSIASTQLVEYNLRSNQGKLMVWGWYEVLGMKLSNPIMIKIIQAWGKVTTRGTGGYFTAIATPYFDNETEARLLLKSFYEQNLLEN